MVEIKGARWYKADLHIHTPESRCFPDKNVTPDQWVDRCLEQGLDCVAITDHNTGNGIDAIKEAAIKKGLTVFPGVEVTCSDAKVHVLVIFDVDKDSSYVNSFLSRLKLFPDMFGKQDAKVKSTVMQVIDEAVEFGGIAIPAHIDQFNGLSSIDHGTRKEIFDSEYVGGVQAVHKSFYYKLSNEEQMSEIQSMYGEGTVSSERALEWKKTLQHAIESNMAILTFSDNPDMEGSSLHGLWGIGNRYTWLKMDEKITLESLRQALVLPDLRVINDFDKNENPPKNPEFWLNNIKISNTILNNQSEETIYFNPYMTTIIGGRGTGKSSVLRFIRGLFNKTSELQDHDDLLKEQEDFFSLQGTKRDGEKRGVLKKESIALIEFIRYGIPFRIEASNFDKDKYTTRLTRWNENLKDFEHIQGQEIDSVLDLFKFDIYSQKQIYEIAKETNALRDKIDKSINGMEDLTYKQKRLIKDYMHQSSHIRKLHTEIEYQHKLKAEIEDKENQLIKFKEGNYQELFNENKKFRSERVSISKVDISLTENKNLIEGLKNNLNLTDFNSSIFSPVHKGEIEQIFDEVKNEFDAIHAHVVDLATQMENLRIDTNKKVRESNWYSKYASNNEDYMKTKDEIGEQGETQLQNLESLTKEIEKKREQLDEIFSIEEQIEKEKKNLEDIRQEYFDIRNQISEERNKFINDVIGDSNHIKMTIKKFRDKRNFEEQFRRIIQREDRFTAEIESLINFCFKGDIQQKIPEFLQKINQVRKGEDDDLITGRFVQVIRSLNEEQLDELNLIVPEDEIKVEYKDNNGNYNSLSNASAGQKTSAILTFLLSHGDTPLILDQPEDDLDNHLIYDLIVERLKTTKSKRQIIIVTHNANIPVNGDSELVIAMDSQYAGLKTKCAGSIENYDVKATICKVMEGGEDAFKLRAKRYNIFE